MKMLHITDETQIALLMDPKFRYYFMPFLGKRISPAQVAREVNTSLQNMNYHIKKMLGTGLLIKLEDGRYTSSAEAYTIKYSVEDEDRLVSSIKSQIMDQMNHMENGIENLIRNKHGGIQFIYRNNFGQAISSNRPPKEFEVPHTSVEGFAKGGSLIINETLIKDLEDRIERIIQEFSHMSINKDVKDDSIQYSYSFIAVKNIS